VSEIDVNAVMAGLKQFQQDTVDHIFERFYGPESASASGRFLVADETGLGKSIIARGLIARAIEHLNTVDDVNRIDVVYVCSNADLATQNLKRLNVTGDKHIGMTTRLTMLARESARLSAPHEGPGKKVNLVSFTPGTSFSDSGDREGAAPERAMLTIILDQLANTTDSHRRVTRIIMQGGVKTKANFEDRIKQLRRELNGRPDQTIVTKFEQIISEDGVFADFVSLRDELRGKQKLPKELKERTRSVIGRLRQALAKAGVETLEPDLVILDEFQRFRHLLDPEVGPASELAHSLFNYPQSRVLLLSATPYKPFTNAEDSDDDHYRDFLTTVQFLAGGQVGSEKPIADALGEYRSQLLRGEDATAAAGEVRNKLLPLMSRNERPPIGEREDLVQVRQLQTKTPSVKDLSAWAALTDLANVLDSPISLDYWKSIPYFVNFMDGYKQASLTQERLARGDRKTARALDRARSLDFDAIEKFEAIDFANGHLRALVDETVGAGWWKLLWLPPTMPYLEPGKHYKAFSEASITKQVIFSAWAAVPTAIASLLSYEADRKAAGTPQLPRSNTREGRSAVSARLSYRTTNKGPATMSTLALFWPHPELAALGDELTAARMYGGRIPMRNFQRLFDKKTDALKAGRVWDAYFSHPGALPDDLVGVPAEMLVPTEDGEQSSQGLLDHVERVFEAQTQELTTHPQLSMLAAFGPANIAWRSLRAVAGPSVSEGQLWRAAFVIAEGLRTLFNRPETIALITGLPGGNDERYWRRVLRYCADGNLRAVLDEYLFQLLSEEGRADFDDEGLIAVAEKVADALMLRHATYVAHDMRKERREIQFTARFALRYGGKSLAEGNEAAGQRLKKVRSSFNSPFAPFVLASTSVGQEGIDFHWWSHSVVHWNLPSNPVDFEQREGRVNRFAGHAVRKNVAHAHWGDVLASDDPRAWRVAFNAALASENELGEFSPWWVYPGPTRIHRVLVHYPLSRDTAKYEQLRNALALYRLTLGQPRQEDMVEILAKRGVDPDDVPTIDLTPPKRASGVVGGA
jgi:hypothetical protein